MREKLIGRMYGKLTIIDTYRYTASSGHRYTKAICKCDCGGGIESFLSNLYKGEATSCGCSHRSNHRRSDHRFWNRARCILNRCNDPKHKAYKNYGGRGIKCLLGSNIWAVVLKLEKIEGFFGGADLDRIDNDGHYKLSNLQWTTRKANSLNKRTTVTRKSLKEIPRTKANIKQVCEKRDWNFEDFTLDCVDKYSQPRKYIAY